MATKTITITEEEYQRLKKYENIVKGDFNDEFIKSIKKSRQEYLDGKTKKIKYEDLDKYFNNLVKQD